MTKVVALVSLLFAAGTGGARLSGEVDAKALEHRLAQEKGRVVLLNFWATWCEPCREEFPALSRLQKVYAGRGLTVLGVSTDLGSQVAQVEKFLAEQRPSFPNYMKKPGGDDQDFIDAVDRSWGGELPFSVVYGPDGKKLRVLSGKQSYGDFEKEVVKLLRPAD